MRSDKAVGLGEGQGGGTDWVVRVSQGGVSRDGVWCGVIPIKDCRTLKISESLRDFYHKHYTR